VSLTAEIEMLSDDLYQASFVKVMESPSFHEIADLFEEYKEYLRNGCSPLSCFWMSYIDLVEIMLRMNRASREGNWQMHLAAIHDMIPWCFSYDKINYARYLSAYYSEMCHLPTEHPEVQSYLEAGGFSVQLTSENNFGKIPVDQTRSTVTHRPQEELKASV
jgi:hypothetical protein